MKKYDLVLTMFGELGVIKMTTNRPWANEVTVEILSSGFHEEGEIVNFRDCDVKLINKKKILTNLV